jgi:CRP-like cAMP-binding protein
MAEVPVTQPTQNLLLGSLPADEFGRMAPHLERMTMDVRELLYDVMKPIEHIYFPETMIGSMVAVMTDGSAVETATIGREGLVGLNAFLGGDRSPAQAYCQVPGLTLRMPVAAFHDAISKNQHMCAMLGRYAEAFLVLVARSGACNLIHNIHQRCARWLLLTHDRVGTDEFSLTQQFLAQMLGVRRATVTETAGALQDTGIIKYAYGRITIVDRARLEAAACECYRIVRSEFDRLMEGRTTASPLNGMLVSESGLSLMTEPNPDKPTKATKVRGKKTGRSRRQ